MRRDHERTMWAAVFFVLLASVVTLSATNLRPLDVRSGAQAVEFPDPTGDRLVDETYYREVDAYLTENLTTRGLGVRARAFIDYEIFGDSTTPLAVVGANKTVFLARYLIGGCNELTPFEPLSARSEEPLSSNIRYMLASPKAAFVGDRLPPFASEPACVDEYRQAREAAIELDPWGISIGDDLDAVQAETEVFFPTDTYWSPAGRLVVAERIVESFAPGLWDSSAVASAEVTRLQGLSRLLGSRESDTVGGFVVDRGPVDIIDIQEFPNLEQIVRRTTRSGADDVVPGTTLIIGDSQMAFLLPVLDSYFEELIFVNWLVFARNADALVPSADRVLIETIELSAPERFASPTMQFILDEF